MWGSLKWFHSYNDISHIHVNIHVKMATGQFAIATHAGTIKFSPDFILTNVFYVPSFSLNLVFVSITWLHNWV